MADAKKITAHSREGRALLALRAGPMSSRELEERLEGGIQITELVRKGYVMRSSESWALTDAGRAACPLRNPLSATVPSRSDPVTGTRYPKMDLASHHHEQRRNTMQNITINPRKNVLTMATGAVCQAIEGITKDNAISREDLIRRIKTDIDRQTLCIVIKRMGAEAVVLGAFGHTSARRYFDIRTSIRAAAAPDNPTVSPQKSEKPEPTVAPAASTKEAHIPIVAPIDFAIHADGRLTIDNGAETMSLPPDATRRLGRFLGCFSENPTL